MLLDKSQVKYRRGDSPPPVKRGKQLLYGSASMMLALMIGVAPYANAKSTSGVIQFDKREYKVPEMAGKVVLHVERKEGDKGIVKVKFGTISGSAKAHFDYMPQMGELVWETGDVEPKSIEIMIKPDKAKESQKEEFFVTLLDDPGHSSTVDFGHHFHTKVMIMDNEKPKPPPPPKPPKPKPGEADDGEDDGMPPPPPPGEEGPPPIIPVGEVAIGTGTQIEVGAAPGQTDLTSVFSLNQTNVVKTETVVSGEVKVVHSVKITKTVSIAQSAKVTKKRKFKVKFKIRDGGDSGLEGLSEAFLFELQGGLQNAFNDDSLEIEAVIISTMGDVLVETNSDILVSLYASEPSESSYSTPGVYAGDDGQVVVFENDDGTMLLQSNVYPALTSDIVGAIVEEYGPLEVSTTGSVTYLSPEGVPIIIVTPSFVVTPSDAGALSVSNTGNGLLLEAEGLGQEVVE